MKIRIDQKRLMSRSNFSLICIFIISLLIMLPARAFAAWTIGVVDDAKYFTNMYQRSIAIDKITGKPHIVYGGDHLYHAYYDGSQWQYETIDTSSFAAGQYANIGIDSNNKVHISYFDDTNDDLKYATNASGSWVISTIDSAGQVGWYTSIALDLNNKAHISYYDASNSALKYATNASGLWITSTIDSAGYVGWYTSIALDLNNKAHISYFDDTNYDLKYATNASGAWVTSTIDSAGYVGYSTSIALDTSNKAHISYYDDTNRYLKYATNVSGSWVTYTIDSISRVGAVITIVTSIAIDTNNKVHISYYNGSAITQDLKYATNASGSWVKSTIDSAGEVGRFTSIALDTNNKAHISYYDNTNYDLKYATNASGSWVKSIIDSSGAISTYSIALDTNNKVHISYYDSTNGDLKYATYVSGSWVTSTIDSGGGSMAIDTNNKVHISYYDSTNGDLKYAANASGSWVISTIDSTGNVGSYASIAIDTNNKVHISYYDSTNGDLKYATNASGSWVISTIDSAGQVGWYTSIALDLNRKAHISYYDVSNSDLKYATNASGSWVTSIIDPAGGGYTSIAIDTNNKAHISYSYSYNLKYATNASGSWVTYTIDSSGGGRTTSIDLDTNGKAHISYYDYNNANLKYATNALGSWITSTIDSVGDVGNSTSIALDTNNNVHISYSDSTNSDLKYATNSPLNFDDDGDGYTENQGDCNDYNSAINPGATEVCDGADNNCNGTVDEGFTNADGDGYAVCAGDCDDNDPAVNPSAAEVPYNGKDDDCNSATRDNDLDVDGYPITTDCNDLDASIHPGAVEVCDHIDNNCDGNIDEGFTDADGDGYAACAGDCNDGDYYVKPGAPEICDGIDNNCDGNNNEMLNCMTTETIDSLGTRGYFSIDVDAQHKVHISYYDNVAQDLKYVTNKSGLWVSYTIDSAGNVGSTNHIKVDPHGNVHISYYDTTNTDLKYVTNASGSWVTQTIDSTGDVGGNNHIAVDSQGNVHISYYDTTNADLKYATNASGPWITNILDSDSAGGGSIAVDPLNKIHIGYVDNFQWAGSKGIKYITNASGPWISYEIDYSWESIGDPSIVVDSNNKAHIIYYKYQPASVPMYFIEYATNTTGPWVVNATLASPPAYTGASMAIDSSDNIHVSFFDINSLHLKYAIKFSGSWFIYEIGSYGYDGMSSSLAVDANRNVHIIASDDGSASSLKYFTNAISLDIDDDGDGFTEYQGDCNDINTYIYPGAADIWYDGTDQNCDRWNDYDQDMDGYVHIGWNSKAGGTSQGINDCDDSNPAINPGAAETWYDGVDENCDGWNDYDSDMDTYVDTAWNTQAGGTSPGTDDCDDSNAVLNPDTNWYTDNDGDGYGDPTVALVQCIQPAGYVLDNTDCDDGNPAVHSAGLPARVLGVTTDYYLTLQDAYNAAGDGDPIQSQDTTFTGDISIGLDKTVFIQGGFDPCYSIITGVTAINGNMTISNGTVTIEDLILQ